MSTRKSAVGSSAVQKSNEALLKAKVRKLEEEIVQLKRRLDELRNAKTTTVLKREREVIHVTAPFGNRCNKANVSKSTIEYINQSNDNSDTCGKGSEIQKTDESTSCNHELEIQLLRQQLTDLQGDNYALTIENHDAKEKVDTLLTELSLKEAKWCETEGNLKLELERSWGEKYREWIEATEAKLEELSQTNTLLRGYLQSRKPQGSDTNRQDEI